MKKNWIVLVIILLGFAIRIWQVGQLPVILNRDEAALAYNAFLLKETGKDEWGQTWPVALQSFGDYKLIGYPLFLIGSFTLFGMSDVAVRLPSVLAGTVLIGVAFFFLRQVLKVEKKWAYFAAFLIAVEPVFFFYSRMAFEANVALTFFTLGITLLFGSRSNRKWDFAAIICFLIAVFTYNTPLLLLPIIFCLLIWWRGFKQLKSWLPAAIGLLLVMAIGGSTLLTLSKQKSGITIFSDETIWKQSVDYHLQFSGLTQKLIGNRVVFFGQVLLTHYAQTFGPEFLVIRGGTHPWHQLPGFAHFGWVVYGLGWIGIGVTLRKVFKSKQAALLLLLLATAPLPAIVTVDAPHATRSLFFFVMWIVFAVLGAQALVQLSKKKAMIWVLVALISIEGLNYFWHYFTQYPSESFAILRGGYEQVIRDVDHQSVTKVAVVDDGGYQYISTAWYLRMPPDEFFATLQHQLPDKIGLRYGYTVGKYRFVKQFADHFADETTVITWQDNAWKVQKL